jgi:hypothetical protein
VPLHGIPRGGIGAGGPGGWATGWPLGQLVVPPTWGGHRVPWYGPQGGPGVYHGVVLGGVPQGGTLSGRQGHGVPGGVPQGGTGALPEAGYSPTGWDRGRGQGATTGWYREGEGGGYHRVVLARTRRQGQGKGSHGVGQGPHGSGGRGPPTLPHGVGYGATGWPLGNYEVITTYPGPGGRGPPPLYHGVVHGATGWPLQGHIL